jgi:DNA polymerase-3 subunit delta
MLVNSNKLSPILNNLPSEIKFALVYGYDEGQISIILQEIQKTLCKVMIEVEVKHFDYTAIKSDMNMLYEEAAIMSLFCTQKIITIDNCKDSFDVSTLTKISAMNNKVFIILRAGELKKNCKLVKFFEKESYCLGVPCYKEEAGAIIDYIKNFFYEQKIIYEQQIPSAIANLVPANRLILRNELEKLLLYKHPATEITMDDVHAVFTPEGELLIDELCLGIGLHKKELLENFLHRADSFAGEFMLIVRSLQNYFLKALTVKTLAEQQNTSVLQIIAGLTPPVFFKQRDRLAKVVQANTAKELKTVLRSLLRLEKQGKQSSISHSLLLGKFLLEYR